jgi:predicted CXXCH cytochrome family protein
MKYLVGAAIGLTMVVSSAAQAQIQNSAHDLSGGTGEICIYCHTPHNGDISGDAPLWNRTMATTTFNMYSNPATIDMTIAADPQDISLACLSCHDGVTAYNNVINDPNGLATDIRTMDAVNPTRAVGSLANSGSLTNDHPISITYDITADTAFKAVATVEGAGLVFYGAGGDQVECATCHNPHLTTGTVSFLRISNTNSALCLACHDK